MGNYYDTLPKKRMGVGALILNERKELLIIKPSYKDHWSTPGGTVDENESPRAACIREVREEVGLEINDPKFLCVDWSSPDGEKAESLQFIFFGGVVSAEEEKSVKLAPREISEYKFLPLDEALPLLSERLSRRIPKCLDALERNTALYFEDAQQI